MWVREGSVFSVPLGVGFCRMRRSWPSKVSMHKGMEFLNPVTGLGKRNLRFKDKSRATVTGTPFTEGLTFPLSKNILES